MSTDTRKAAAAKAAETRKKNAALRKQARHDKREMIDTLKQYALSDGLDKETRAFFVLAAQEMENPGFCCRVLAAMGRF